jgi:phage terminase small subunit
MATNLCCSSIPKRGRDVTGSTVSNQRSAAGADYQNISMAYGRGARLPPKYNLSQNRMGRGFRLLASGRECRRQPLRTARNRSQTSDLPEGSKMPRRSAASFTGLNITGAPERLRPPPELTEIERKIFVDIVAANKPDHFRPSDVHLLVGYCGELARLRKASAHLEAEGEVVDGRVNPWLAVVTASTKSVLAYAHRLRLSPQGRSPTNPKRPESALSHYELMALQEEQADEAN